ncbi:MAG: hypothetical protein A2600_04460 [Candidatus Lambdaproteobacteria bacterium RIFOXYD1_FULL_56_27]|uniref:UDP-glucose/GDP-mannose dehydrogenase C-terminal domain-containing protein n=1 Tax=Candidatus Lambdaproteobacteria bacterium RIFOXYD2_FULL_56_26 TaxID=1817773 RepID=A0A1F6H3U5_9PROT|nr:MAG: hypothetical protein A2426_13525 [Candidatus Lambdaproteobacteria bacterium RIFOXYC1_FULL_56_13]OGH05006.1 MAG: hypothetical protein A2557_08525 [Candidatus Lambdaproteobacteria bacterium RIFOXYD2_FULL_56_26]OGH09471.1 MAG: hypothetical protein A2600_04460 [Candidatus Lambdaproteobacteria bacterium RIFOXYD1_FULL_56_27]
MAFEPQLSVIGLGYGGLPIAMAFSKKWPLKGFDLDRNRINQLQEGFDRTGQYESDQLLGARIHFTAEAKQLRDCNFHLVAVPTPLNEEDQPDLSPLVSACKTIGTFLSRGDIVVFLATVAPGTTEDLCLYTLEQASGLIGGVDFKLAYSPNRIDPGNREQSLLHTPRLVAAEDEATLATVLKVFRSVVQAEVTPVGSILVAEAAKVLEVTQEDLNHALMNEMAIILDKMDISGHEVIQAAATNPSFRSYVPGLTGGRYNAAAPYYLSQKALTLGYTPQVILAGRRVNDHMSNFIAAKVVKELVRANQPVLGAKVTLMGLTLAADSSDIRHTKLKNLIRELQEFGMDLQFHDPHADPHAVKEALGMLPRKFEDLALANALVVLVPHQEYREFGLEEWLGLMEPQGVVLDLAGFIDPKPLISRGHRCWNL